MNVLTETQLDILNGYAEAGNRVACYTALSSYGYSLNLIKQIDVTSSQWNVQGN